MKLGMIVEEKYRTYFTIVSRFLCFKDKRKILQNEKKLKDTGIFIYEDFCSDTMEIRKS